MQRYKYFLILTNKNEKIMAWVQFQCKELGRFSLKDYATYEAYKRIYPDMEPVPNGNLFRNIFNELEDYTSEL